MQPAGVVVFVLNENPASASALHFFFFLCHPDLNASSQRAQLALESGNGR